jgi:hypothetical protein
MYPPGDEIIWSRRKRSPLVFCGDLSCGLKLLASVVAVVVIEPWWLTIEFVPVQFVPVCGYS